MMYLSHLTVPSIGREGFPRCTLDIWCVHGSGRPAGTGRPLSRRRSWCRFLHLMSDMATGCRDGRNTSSLQTHSGHDNRVSLIQAFLWDKGALFYTTGCPISKFPLCFCHFLGFWSTYRETFFNSPGNFLHDSFKNFENWFRISLDIWGQSWHPSFRNWHFTITMRQKNNFSVTGRNFDLN